MNQDSGDIRDESEQPQNQQNYYNCPNHLISSFTVSNRRSDEMLIIRAAIPLYFYFYFAFVFAVRLHFYFDFAVRPNAQTIASDLKPKGFARFERVGDTPQFVGGLRRVRAFDINFLFVPHLNSPLRQLVIFNYGVFARV
jgi:hypothetical protein